MSCNILLPYYSGASPLTCSNITCISFTPSCFTPTSTNLCGYLQGIDSAICALQSCCDGTFSCENIIMQDNSYYNCIDISSAAGNPLNLCQWADAVNTTFCEFGAAMSSNGTGTGTSVNVNMVSDASNGTFVSVGGITAGVNSIIAASNSVVHGSSANSGAWTSGATATHTLSTTTVIPVAAGQTYIGRVFVYGAIGSYPVGATVTLSVNGTGTQTQTGTLTLGVGNAGAWNIDPVIYVPDIDQNITLTITCTGFTNGTHIYVADLIFEPLTSSNGGGNYDYNLAQINDLNGLFTAMANNFVYTGGSLTSSSLNYNIGIGASSYVINGKRIYANSATVVVQATKDNYIFFDTWIGGYTNKYVAVSGTPPNPDSTEILVCKATTDGSGTVTLTDERIYTPYTGSQIAPLTILGGTANQIGAATITSYNLATTGVGASTYGDATHTSSITVNAQGQITAASQVAITYPVTSVNGATGAVSLGLGDLNNVTITAPSNGDLIGYNGAAYINSSLASRKIAAFNGSPLGNYITWWATANTITGTANYQRGTFNAGASYGICINDSGAAFYNALTMLGTYSAGYGFYIQNSYNTAANTAYASGVFYNDIGNYFLIANSSNELSTIGLRVADQAILESNGSAGMLFNALSGGFQFGCNNVQAIKIDSGGRAAFGTSTPNTSSILDLQSTTGALLIPRMTTVQKGLLTPADGMVIYDTTLNQWSFYSNGSWTNPF